jgi:creatinine amidohydrolase
VSSRSPQHAAVALKSAADALFIDTDVGVDHLPSALPATTMLNGYIPAHRFLPYLSWTDIAALPDRENTVIVLPAGATEQHGPHLPCSVDAVIASGVMGHALARLPAEVPAYALSPIVYGKSEEHLHFPGTMTLSGPTLLATVTELGESVYRSGFRKLLIANGHGGQPQVMEMAARELRLRHGDFVVLPHSVWRMPSGLAAYTTEREKQLAMHAGHGETALMLALAPETVRMARAVAEYPPPFPIASLSTGGRPGCAWSTLDFSASGVVGDPTAATPDQGHAILESLASHWAQAIEDIHRLRWVERAAPTWGRGHEQGHVQVSAFAPE